MSFPYYNNYIVERVQDNDLGLTVYDLYVAPNYEEHGWEYYCSYEDVDEAHAEGVAYCKKQSKEAQ